MANFQALTYNPYGYSSTVGSRPVYDMYEGRYKNNAGYTVGTPEQWDVRSAGDQRSQFQGYAGDQFSGMTDAINQLGSNPLSTGSAFAPTPQYSPYAGNRAAFTEDGTFDQQGYLDARFNNINSYLNNLGSFIGGLSGDQQAQVNSDRVARSLYQASLPQLQQSSYAGGGWGQQSSTPQTWGTPITHRGQSPSGMLGTTNRGSHGGILGGNE
jgi:hypothetical protein